MKKTLWTIAIVLLAFAFTGSVWLWAVADIEKDWDAGTTEIANSATGADGAYDWSSNVDLGGGGYEGTQITVVYDTDNTDNLIVSVFASRDGANYDDLEYWSMTCDNNGGVSTQITFIVRDLKHFRIGLKDEGNDTIDYVVNSDPWNWEF